MKENTQENLYLASDEAIKDLAVQTIFCLKMDGAAGWPQIDPKHGQELLREIRYWREQAGLL